MKRLTGPFDVVGQLASLRRYARSLVRNPQDAEDLVHDALVKAYERKESFRSGGNIRTWLMSILHNAHIDRIRRERSADSRHEAVAVISETVANANPDHAIRLTQLRQAFFHLPDEQREALHLVAIEGLTYPEAAEALGIPVGTLMSRISRARAKLRAMEDDGADGEARPAHLRLVGGIDNEPR